MFYLQYECCISNGWADYEFCLIKYKTHFYGISFDEPQYDQFHFIKFCLDDPGMVISPINLE